MELDALIADIRTKIEAQLNDAAAAELADALKQPRKVARDSFKAVANDYRRALGYLDEATASLDRARRNLAHTQVEDITDRDQREAALKRILGE